MKMDWTFTCLRRAGFGKGRSKGARKEVGNGPHKALIIFGNCRPGTGPRPSQIFNRRGEKAIGGNPKEGGGG